MIIGEICRETLSKTRGKNVPVKVTDWLNPICDLLIFLQFLQRYSGLFSFIFFPLLISFQKLQYYIVFILFYKNNMVVETIQNTLYSYSVILRYHSVILRYDSVILPYDSLILR